MERYFTTVALLGVNDGNLPVHRSVHLPQITPKVSSMKLKPETNMLNFFEFRGMRQKRYESVEKMLDLLDICKRIGPKFPLDAMFLDPHDRKI